MAVAGATALFRPHASTALRTSNEAPVRHATLDRAGDLATTESPRTPGTSASRVVVYVTGEVKRPGVYTVDPRSRVEGALRAASGPTSKADLLAVNLAEPLSDGERVLVPAKGDASVSGENSTPTTSAYASNTYSATSSYGPSRRHHRRFSAAASGHHRRSHRSHKAPPSEPIDINAADATQLEQLPGIGPSLAERIVTFREVNGPYRSTVELLDVAGMTDKRLDQISQYVVVRQP